MWFKHRLSWSSRVEVRAHVVEGGLLQRGGSGITKSKDQITRLSDNSFLLNLKIFIFSFEMCLFLFISLRKVGVVVVRKVWLRRAEDGHHKMGAHEAGRVACHASSLEWAVKSAAHTFLSIKTSAFHGVFFYFKKQRGLLREDPPLPRRFFQFPLFFLQF